jgi:hypothetical protein
VWVERDGEFPNEDRRLVVYFGQTRGVYDTDPPKPEFMLLAEPNGSGASTIYALIRRRCGWMEGNNT